MSKVKNVEKRIWDTEEFDVQFKAWEEYPG